MCCPSHGGRGGVCLGGRIPARGLQMEGGTEMPASMLQGRDGDSGVGHPQWPHHRRLLNDGRLTLCAPPKTTQIKQQT